MVGKSKMPWPMPAKQPKCVEENPDEDNLCGCRQACMQVGIYNGALVVFQAGAVSHPLYDVLLFAYSAPYAHLQSTSRVLIL